jgi:trimeric autotransporter adhesin
MEIFRESAVGTSFVVPLINSANRPYYLSAATLHPNDIRVLRHTAGVWNNAAIATMPTEVFSGTGLYNFTLSNTELTPDDSQYPVIVKCHQASATTWDDQTVVVWTKQVPVEVKSIRAGAIMAEDFAAGSLTSSAFANNFLTAALIAPSAIGATQISTNAIGPAQIAANAFNSTNFSPGTFTAPIFANGALTTSAIANNALTTGKFASNFLTAALIAPSAIGSSQLSTNAIGPAQIAANAFNSTNFAANTFIGQAVLSAISVGSVTEPVNATMTLGAGSISASTFAANALIGQAVLSAISVGSVTNPVAATVSDKTGYSLLINSISASTIAAGAITNTKFAAGAIDATVIATGAIDADSIATGAITNAKFAAGAIDAAAIADNAIDANTLATGTITAAKFAANAITSTVIAANAIDNNKIATGAITAGAFAAGAIDNAAMGSNAIDSTKFADGTITAAKFAAGAINAAAIATGAIDADSIAAGAFSSTKFAANALIGQPVLSAISVGSVTNPVVAGTVSDKTGYSLAANAVDSTSVANGAFTAAKFAANALIGQPVLSAISVGSVTNGVTVSDKTGFSLTTSYDSAKQAALSGALANVYVDTQAIKAQTNQLVFSNSAVNANATVDTSNIAADTVALITSAHGTGLYNIDNGFEVSAIKSITDQMNFVTTIDHGTALVSVLGEDTWGYVEIGAGASNNNFFLLEYEPRFNYLTDAVNNISAVTNQLTFTDGKVNANADVTLSGVTVTIDTSAIAADTVALITSAHGTGLYNIDNTNDITLIKSKTDQLIFSNSAVNANATLGTGSIIASTFGANALIGQPVLSAISVGSVTNGVTLALSAINNNTFAAAAITSGAIASNAIMSSKVATGTITSNTFAANAIAAAAIASNAITSAKIAAGAFTAPAFAAGALTTSAFANGAITSATIADFTINTNKFANCAFTAPKFCTSALMFTEVLSARFVDKTDYSLNSDYDSAKQAATSGALDNVYIDTQAIKAKTDQMVFVDNRINANASVSGVTVTIDTSAIADQVDIKLTSTHGAGSWKESLSAASNIVNIKSKTDQLIFSNSAVNANASVTLGAGSISASTFAANALIGQSVLSAISVGSVTNNVTLGANAIGATQIATGAITNTKFANGAIDNLALGDNAIDARVIADNAINETAIGTGAITTRQIATGAFTSDAFANNALIAQVVLSAISVGSVTNSSSVTVDTSAIAAATANLITSAHGTGLYNINNTSDITLIKSKTDQLIFSNSAVNANATVTLGVGSISASTFAPNALINQSVLSAATVGSVNTKTGYSLVNGSIVAATFGANALISQPVLSAISTDKTGYSLTNAYDSAKQAALSGSLSLVYVDTQAIKAKTDQMVFTNGSINASVSGATVDTSAIALAVDNKLTTNHGAGSWVDNNLSATVNAIKSQTDQMVFFDNKINANATVSLSGVTIPIDTSAIAMAVDNELTISHGTGSWKEPGAFGINDVTIIVTDDASTVLPDTFVTIMNSDQSVIIDSKKTGPSGSISFSLDNGSYVIRLRKNMYSFTNTHITVSADASITVVGTVISVIAPNVDLQNIIIIPTDLVANITSASTITAELSEYCNSVIDNVLINKSVTTAYWNVDHFELPLLIGSKVKITGKDNVTKRLFLDLVIEVTDESIKNITEYIL